MGGIGRSQVAALRLAAENARAAVKHRHEEEMAQKLDFGADDLRASAQSPANKSRSINEQLTEILPTNGLVYSEKGALRYARAMPTSRWRRCTTSPLSVVPSLAIHQSGPQATWRVSTRLLSGAFAP